MLSRVTQPVLRRHGVAFVNGQAPMVSLEESAIVMRWTGSVYSLVEIVNQPKRLCPLSPTARIH